MWYNGLTIKEYHVLQKILDLIDKKSEYDRDLRIFRLNGFELFNLVEHEAFLSLKDKILEI